MPGSIAATHHGNRGGETTGEVFGSPSHCATCDQDRVVVAIASDPKRPRSGRWYVCGGCRAQGDKHHCGLVYESIGAS